MSGKGDEIYPLELVHSRCGGTYLARSAGEVAGPEADCPVCLAVRESYRESGGRVIRATAGTPLALELGLVVLEGRPGPTE